MVPADRVSLTAREIMYNNFEISLVVFMPNITTNHAVTYTNSTYYESETFFNSSPSHIFEFKILGFLFFTKNSLTWEVRCDN